MKRSQTKIILTLLCASLMLGQAVVVRASTVAQVNFDDVVAEAELIFEGRVMSVESRQSGGVIHTHVRFEVLDVLKGDFSEAEIELRYLGGRVGNRLMEVTHMQIPTRGETGFYFVESLARNLVHPLVGWAQGHYLIESGPDGESSIHTAGGQSVYRVTAPDPSTPALPLGISDGTAAGVQVNAVSAADRAMTADQFRRHVQERLVIQGRRLP